MQDNIYILPSREPAASRQTLKSNLPARLTSFVGREREVAAAYALLRRSDVRLLTLTGPGGVGKTRLALQIATDLQPDFADGIAFVPLSAISDPDLVIPTIAQTFTLREAGDRPPLEHLKTYLREKDLLLLLDNFEQVVTAAPLLIELLQACPHLKVIVTSRAVLHVSGEQEFAVPPLALPDLKHLPKLDMLPQYAALSLFIQRARAITPNFQLTKDNAPSVAEICTRLDGLPLAIELAAARIKLLPPQALHARLGQRLQLLTSGAQDAPARQQTLRNTIEWSYQLLDAAEQRLFRRLSIFTGGCTLEAATVVIETIDPASNADRRELALEVLEGVASLIDKHLLQQTAQDGEEPRLVMLETIREYGIERLRRDNELEATRQAHAAYYAQLAEEAFRYLFSSAAAGWFERLEQEHGNLRAAFEWALERENEVGGSGIEVAVRLGSVLWRFWTIRGYLSEGRAMLERLLVASARSAAALRAKVLYAMTVLVWFQEAYARLETLCEEQLALCQQIEDQRGMALVFCGMTVAAYRHHDIARAQALSEQWVAAAKAAGDPYQSAAALLFQGRLASAQDDYPRAQLLFEEALTLFRGLGYQGDIAWPLIYMARNLIRQSEHDRARVLLEEALTLCRTVNYKWGLAHTVGFLGQVTIAQGDVESTREYLTESLRLNQEVGNQRSIAWSFFLLASVVFVEGKSGEARALYEQSLSIATALEHRGLIASSLQGLAAVMAVQGQPGFAARLWGAAEAIQQNGLTSLPYVLRTPVEQARATARLHLGDRSFASAEAEGRAMTLEQIFAALKTTMAQSPSQTAWIQDRSVEHSLPHQPGLTTREMEVLRLVAQGLTDAQVAEQLVISPRTVNWHLTSIYGKLQVSSRAAATRYAIEQRLL